MDRATVQDWTTAAVRLDVGEKQQVRYRVYRDGNRHYQEIKDVNERHLQTLELPDGIKLDRSSFETLVRYVLLDLVAA